MGKDADPKEWEGVSPEGVADFAKSIGLLDAAPNRVSQLLMLQLYLQAAPDGIAAIAVRVVTEIEALEGLGPSYGMKALESFEKLPLRGLMKQHYLPRASMSVQENIKNEMRVQRERLSIFITDQTQKLGEGFAKEQAWEAAGAISKLVYHDFWNDRKMRGKATGQWIVVAQHEGQNYYLTLAEHDEGENRKETDQRIYDRIVECCIPQFPFLTQIINTKRA